MTTPAQTAPDPAALHALALSLATQDATRAQQLTARPTWSQRIRAAITRKGA